MSVQSEPRTSHSIVTEQIATLTEPPYVRLIRRVRALPTDLWRGIAFCFIALILIFCMHYDQNFNAPIFLAERFLQGHISFEERQSFWEMFEREGKFYPVYAPMVSLVLVPFTAIIVPPIQYIGSFMVKDMALIALKEHGWQQPLANTLFLLISGILLNRLFLRVRFLMRWADLATVAYLFGTQFLYSVGDGSVWLLIHSEGNCFMLASLLMFSKRKWAWAGFWFALAIVCRNALVFSVPFVPFLLWRGRWIPRNRARFLYKTIRFSLGALAPIAVAFGLNWAMSGSPFITTYQLGYTEWRTESLYNLKYFKANFSFYTTAMPLLTNKDPYLRFPPCGQAAWSISPFLLFALLARLHTRTQRAMLMGAVCCFTPYLFFIWNGYAQYGARYVTDVFPFLFPLTFSGASRLKGKAIQVIVYVLVALAIVINVIALMQSKRNILWEGL